MSRPRWRPYGRDDRSTWLVMRLGVLTLWAMERHGGGARWWIDGTHGPQPGGPAADLAEACRLARACALRYLARCARARDRLAGRPPGVSAGEARIARLVRERAEAEEAWRDSDYEPLADERARYVKRNAIRAALNRHLDALAARCAGRQLDGREHLDVPQEARP